ncbi:LysR family transcriptional regulator [Lactiplantibacillus sp. WILCCON 0030]|uniref:LysR family transcriptional regulator n=1 Tax=Lactiplantibacillus brownii TaxID=3069269 RepID=A0ABU1ABG5_9LACO|nr:LysR family transcriptional regulator [Lactiplantibacillus brownii]MDQ7937980.1 LysR family transcriptional regulator [Lactiplantibacillus brownii]
MDTRLLHYFTVLTRVGNITKAANELHTTQPTLSRQLKELEAEIGTQLFIRGKRAITLTDAGVLFEQRAQTILNYLDQTRQDLHAQKHGLAGTLRIGCVESRLSSHVADWVATFQQQHPNVQFSLFGADGNSIRNQLDQGKLDVGFLLEPVESAKYFSHVIPVTETWGLIMAKSAPLASHAAITGADLTGIPLIGSRRSIVINQIATWLHVDSDSLNLRGERNLENNVIPLMTNHGYYDIGIDGVLDFYPQGPLTFVPFKPISQTRHTLIWRKNQQPSPIAQAFIDDVTAQIRTMPI